MKAVNQTLVRTKQLGRDCLKRGVSVLFVRGVRAEVEAKTHDALCQYSFSVGSQLIMILTSIDNRIKTQESGQTHRSGDVVKSLLFKLLVGRNLIP